MTRKEAHALLDAARDGETVSEQLIVEALEVTGDLSTELPVQTWRAADDWAGSAFGRLSAPAGPFDGLLQ